MRQRLTLVLYGTVQGVTLRWHVTRRAHQLKLHGFVQNLPDGSVKLVAEGEATALQGLLNWLQQSAHPWRIRHAQPAWSSAHGGFTDFTVQW